MLLIYQFNFESSINHTQKQNIIFELKYPRLQNINYQGVNKFVRFLQSSGNISTLWKLKNYDTTKNKLAKKKGKMPQKEKLNLRAAF